MPSALTRPIWASTMGWTASIDWVGEPSVTIAETRSGRRAPSARAKTPPRLWPMITTRSSWRSAMCSSRASRRLQASSEQSKLARMPVRWVQ